MTLIIRAPGVITTPLPGSRVPPALGVAGVIGRYWADSFTGADGDAVTTWADSSAAGHPLNKTAGAPVLDLIDGKRTVHVPTAGVFDSGAFALPGNITLAARVYVEANPSGTSQFFMSQSNAGVLACLASGQFTLYGNGANFPVGTNPAKPTWVTIVGAFNADTDQGKISVNGTLATGALSWDPGATRRILLRAENFAAGLRFRDLVVLDHYASDAEIAALSSVLTTS